jgi:DNA-binding GntR family transcriptional regulator
MVREGELMLDPGAHVPVYLQLAQLLRQEIMAGRYVTGDTLPGENVLAAQHQLSSNTVRRAIGVLREEGLVTTRRGAGSVVASVPHKISIEVTPDTKISARMPTREERKTLGLAEGVPVLAVRRPDGQEALYDASRAEVKYSSLRARRPREQHGDDRK